MFGLAVMNKKLYVLRQRPDKQIYVYDSDNYELTDDYITLPGFSVKEEGWNDMTECEAEKCLFVSDFTRKCIRKVSLEGEPKVTKFAEVPYPPKGLSITPEGNLLVSCDPDKLLELNAKTGEKVFEMELHSDILFPKHAIKRKDKQYVVSFDVKVRIQNVGCGSRGMASGESTPPPPSHRSVPHCRQMIFVSVTGHLGLKFGDYVGFMSKTGYLYIRPTHFASPLLQRPLSPKVEVLEPVWNFMSI